MKRTSLGILIPGAIFMAIFNLLLFVIGDASEFTASVWISYAFIHFAFIVSIGTPLLTSGKLDFARQSNVSYIFTIAYFVLAFVTGLIFILVAPDSEGGVTASWLLQVIWLAIFIIAFVPVLMANRHTNAEVARQGKEARFVQDAASRVKLLRDFATDPKIINELDILSSVISSSPIKSAPDVKELEALLSSQISDLRKALDDNDLEKALTLCQKITRNVKERNRVLQLVSHTY